jgi:hypothetical protein
MGEDEPEKDEEEAIRKAFVDWSDLPCEARFWEGKLGPAKVHYL